MRAFLGKAAGRAGLSLVRTLLSPAETGAFCPLIDLEAGVSNGRMKRAMSAKNGHSQFFQDDQLSLLDKMKFLHKTTFAIRGIDMMSIFSLNKSSMQ